MEQLRASSGQDFALCKRCVHGKAQSTTYCSMKHFNTVQRSACLLCLLNIQATAIAILVSV
eukprot:4886-Heterococcus_DN1.PRE.3